MGKKRAILGISGIAVTAAILLGTAPSSGCACAEPWMIFLWENGLYEDDRGNLDAEVINKAGAMKFVGKPMASIEVAKNVKPTSCKERNSQVLDCEFWLFYGPLRETGYHVVAKADAKGIVTSYSVTGLSKFMGRRSES